MEAYRKQLTSISEYLLCVWNPARYVICKYLKLSMPKLNSLLSLTSPPNITWTSSFIHVVVNLKRQDGLPSSKFDLDVETDDATHVPKECKMFTTHIMRLLGRVEQIPKLVQKKKLEWAGKGGCIGVLLWLGGEARIKVLTSTKGGNTRISLAPCPGVGWKGRRSSRTCKQSVVKH